jgi:radical SAM superfamily enzyme YgiQ (UPF0313 family)
MARTLKFLLINPTASFWRVSGAKGPKRSTRMFRFSMLSSLTVAAAMPPGVETRILDEEVEPIDRVEEADLIGISFMTFNAPRAYELADDFRKRLGKTVIFGGYHPTFLPDEAIRHADSVCVGEAEKNLPRMIEDFAAGTLKPFYDGGLADLGELRIPDRNLVRKSAYVIPDVIQATRGCPNRCTFCSITSFFKHKFRARPVDQVIEELRGLRRDVMFLDDNMIADRDYARELFARMAPLRKTWFGQCGINFAEDDELMRLASASGCRGMFIGLESLSQDNLNDCRKNVNRAVDYVRAVERIHARGIGVFAGLVFGMDGDEPDVFQKTLEFLREAKIDALQATVFTPFPGTEIHDDLERQGRIISRNWELYDFKHVVFAPKHMSPEALKDGHDWILARFYSQKSIARRLWKALGYLDPGIVVRGLIPLNLGYRIRLSAEGTTR